MNIKDVDGVPPSDNFIKSIFERQLQLEEKYKEIEGFPWPWPLEIDIPNNQIWLKDVMWRVTEELAESMEAEINKDSLHQAEELSDALHFLVQLMLMSGIAWDDSLPIFLIPGVQAEKLYLNIPIKSDIIHNYWAVVYYLGLAGNCLKSKKWKQTPMLTDKDRYKDYLRWAFFSLLAIFKRLNYTFEEVYIIYYKKSAVNEFRQRTKY